MNNLIKTTFLLTALTLLLMAIGGAAGGHSGMMTAFVFACVLNFSAYWFSDRIILSMYQAQPISELDAPEIFTLVRELAERMKMPMPRIYVIPSATPNAFATGRDPRHAVVAMTQGIMDLLSREELRGVLAHELSHVRNRDILVSSIAATLAGAISMLGSMLRWGFMMGRQSRDERNGNGAAMLVMAILAPIAAALIQLAISRSREFGADETGGHFCGNPLFLASALRRLEAGTARVPLRNAEPSTAHLFIVNPLSGEGLTKLFSTHPPIEERIARLEKMARQNVDGMNSRS